MKNRKLFSILWFTLLIFVSVSIPAAAFFFSSTGTGGTGTVAGPGSSTDNAIVRWDGTGGDTLQNSSPTVDDSGNVALGNTAGPELLNEAASGTNPTVLPNKADDDTGVGSQSADIVNVIGGGLEIARFAEVGNKAYFFPQGATDTGAPLTVNETYRGEIAVIDVDDASAVFGNALYIAADFNCDRADADASSTGPAVYLALQGGSGSSVDGLIRGQICDTDWNWSAGKIYLSTTTGELTQTAPSGTGDQVQVLGYALSADTMYFAPELDTIEIP